MGATVDLTTFSDIDFYHVYRWKVGEIYFNFTGYQLSMMVRRRAEDYQATIALSSAPGGGIEFSNDEVGAPTYFTILIPRAELARMAPGDYVHSLIITAPDQLRDDIWRGTLTHSIGPTR